MIRKIPVHKLLPGMFVVDLHKSWFEHGLWRHRFKVRDGAVVDRLIEDGVAEVSIDTARGGDLPLGATQTPARVQGAGSPYRPAFSRTKPFSPPVSLGEERRRAGRLLREATDTLREIMGAARAGRKWDAGRLEPLIGKMIESVLRNPDALGPLARLKQKHSYATEHAVATTALLIALARQQGQGQGEMEKLALGSLLKDVGQSDLEIRLSAKPSRLSSQELSLVQSHVEEGMAVLKGGSRLPEAALAVVLEHHERFDGSGYPYSMSGEDISVGGRMAAIVDTYDAMTSDRPYRDALSPVGALRHLYAAGGALFDPAMVAGFIHAVGVYPVGTLVRLESDHLGVVEEVHRDDPLHPVVRVIFHAGRRQYVTPVQVDLARRHGNHFGQIVRDEEFRRWGLSPQRWQPA